MPSIPANELKTRGVTAIEQALHHYSVVRFARIHCASSTSLTSLAVT